MEEETLSDKSRMGGNALPLNEPFILTEDVKEFIKRLKQEASRSDWEIKYEEIIDELAGEKLI